MPIVKCNLLSHSRSSHLYQLHTGFLMLHKAGVIELSQQIIHKDVSYTTHSSHLADAGHAHLEALVDGNTRLHFDTHDSMEIANDDLNKCDLYFKRSYYPPLVKQLPTSQRRKVVPLGLNYRVLPNTVDHFLLRRNLAFPGSLHDKLAGFKQSLDSRNLLGFQPRLKNMESFPDFSATPKVLFLAAIYDPYDHPDRTKEKVDERIYINETRAKCIRLLKREFKNRFLGGLSKNDFSLKNYKDLVAPQSATIQENYIKTLKSYPICIASMGLHGSIGWKLAEYVAFSKAIVSEKLLYSVPGNFEAGKNYLEFKSPEECVDAAVKLATDSILRREMMANNSAYYRSHVRPDTLVLNTLVTALKQKSPRNLERIRSLVETHEQDSLVHIYRSRSQ